MPLNASSEWISRIQGKKPIITRQFFIGTSDYSGYVLKWPRIKTDWIKMAPNNVTINLANEDRAFNFLRDDGLGVTLECEVRLGQITAVDSLESITLFKGNIGGFKYKSGACAISIVDRWNQLTNRVVGTEDVPVDYTTSNYLPSDLAWYLCTSHGGLSAIGSGTNTDIDKDSFDDWSAIMSGSSILMQAYLKGVKAVDGLRRIGHLTNTAIYTSPDNRLTFKRFSLIDSNTTNLSDSIVKDTSLEIRGDAIVNKFYQKAGYSVASDYHTVTVFDIDSDSVNSYGLHEEIEGDKIVWFVNTASALDSAQRLIQQYSIPSDDMIVDTVLAALPSLIGETLIVEDTLLGIDLGYRVENTDVDYDTGSMKVRGSRRLFFNGFTLDVSTLNGPDILS